MKIGVLALQGAFIEHIKMLNQLGTTAVEIRLPHQLNDIDGLIIPGGESTTIGKLATIYNLMDPLRAFATKKPVWGTCAGMIFMAKEIGQDQPLLGLMNINVERNAFGRQVDSFEAGLHISTIADTQDHPFPAIFIRAPKLVSAGPSVNILATLPDGTAVAAQQDHWLVTSFHPELSTDTRLHNYFLHMVTTQKETALPAN
ncbi:MAG TPA: pyridoxal 5'-phosphate synthase glutaminase subunit PdxT [Anaerolineae bacterium]|nr:pyridoxal 5'-phosphate synthase glutaminase subunit PdxT [Anaerolineae bacterium]